MRDVSLRAMLTFGCVGLCGVAALFGGGDELSARPELSRRAKPSPMTKSHPPVRLINAAAARVEKSALNTEQEFAPPASSDEDPPEIIAAMPSQAVRFRTWCVRLCDGYYYPMNYLTTRGRLQADEDKCRSRCSSESRLFVNAIVGRKASPLMDRSGLLYSELPTAFQYRREISSACTCDGSRMEITSSTLNHAAD